MSLVRPCASTVANVAGFPAREQGRDEGEKGRRGSKVRTQVGRKGTRFHIHAAEVDGSCWLGKLGKLGKLESQVSREVRAVRWAYQGTPTKAA
jgi:hypothetical protein